MATSHEAFQRVLTNFTARLTKEELENFKFSSLGDVQIAVKTIQDDQGRRNSMMNLPRIQGFLEAMDQYGKVIEVFLNASSLLCFIWGPMKFILQVASVWADSFDTLLDAYQQLAENIPLLKQFQALFSESSQMTGVLCTMYEDILEFHLCALRVFTKSTWRQLFRATWKDFKSRFQRILDDLHRHKALIECQANILQIQEARTERANVRASFTAIEEAEKKNKRLVVLNWLSAAKTILDQEASAEIRRDYPSTGRWVLENPTLKSWLDPSNALLPMVWMNGIPGAGKTILTSLIIEECLKRSPTAIVFFYCKYEDDQRNSFLAVARSLLAQMMNQHEDLLLSYLYDQCISSGQVSLVSSQLCIELLETSLKTLPKTLIILDGIDECEITERKAIISFFTTIIGGDSTVGKLRGLFVSQDENDIRKLLKKASLVRLTDGHKSDIDTYTTHWSIRIREKFDLPSATQEYIWSAVSEGSEGMFLYAKLVLTNLYNQTTREKLFEELQPDIFPKGFEQAYSRVVTRIYQNPNEGERETARSLLGLIVAAKRPLKWHEIQGAVSIHIEEHVVDFDNRRLFTHVSDLCGSLIDVLPGDRVQLVHSTAKSYLDREDYVQTRVEECKLAVLCLKYLMFECFDPELPDESISQYLKQGYYAFQDYAALHWVDHLEISIPFLNLDIFDDTDNIGTAINEFYGMYVESKLETDVVSEELRERCSHLKDTGYLESLLSLVNHARKSRTADEMVTALGDVGRVLSKSRLLLEQQHSSANVTGEEKGRLKEYYGDHWNKCPRHACYYFHEGFSDVIRRDNHVSRHEKPFCCTELSCPRIHLGFSTEKELKKHMNINHPDPAAFAWRFPKVKKPPQKYTCKKCDPPKEYTRAHNLNIHMRMHENRRPYACQFCTRAFVRKYDYQRHMQVLHRDKKEQVMESSLETLVGSDKTDSEVGTSELVSSMSSDTLVGMAPGNITPM